MATSDFWDTMKLLVERSFTRNINENMQDWVDSFMPKKDVVLQGEVHDDLTVWERRMSVLSQPDDFITEDKIRRFFRDLNLPKIDCKFSHPQIRSRLEKLMGSNTVYLTDRKYMQRLQERILEDYAESMDKRIKVREGKELERVKNLVLIGKIPLKQAPPEMAQHPVMLIEQYCNKLIAERRAKIKIPKVKIPTYLYWDDTPDPESGLSIEKGHIFKGHGTRLCIPADTYLEKTVEEDIETGYMMTQEDFEKIKYQDPLVKRLMTCETVNEMYALADEIIGVLKTIDENAIIYEDAISLEAPQDNS